MDEEEIRRLEPKYTGNTKHLTEGEAAEIINDPDNYEDADEDGIIGERMALAALFANVNGGNGVGNGGGGGGVNGNR